MSESIVNAILKTNQELYKNYKKGSSSFTQSLYEEQEIRKQFIKHNNIKNKKE